MIDNDITDVVAEDFDAGVRIGGQISRDMIAVRITPDPDRVARVSDIPVTVADSLLGDEPWLWLSER